MRGRFWEQIRAVENKLIKCVAIEDISSKFMLKNRKLARVASDAAWFQFSTILEYELFKYQRESLQRVSPRNTTQKCSNCGTLVPKDLSIRVHVCPCCGFVCDRDVNAGCNIVDGRERWTQVEIRVVEVQYRNGDERKFTPVETWTSASMMHMLT